MQRIRFVLFSAVVVLTASQFASAQSDEKRFEVGGQFTFFRVLTRSLRFVGTRLVETDEMKTVKGFGGRFGYNVTKQITLEAEVNFFPNDSDLVAGHKTQGLFGIKAGKRFSKIGLFGKARPGLIRFQKGDYAPGGKPSRGAFGGSVCSTQDPSPLDGCVHPIARNRFAFDVGGVVEIYPSKRTLIRVDVGKTIIRLDARGVAALRKFAVGDGFEVLQFAPSETQHKLQTSIGFGFRF